MRNSGSRKNTGLPLLVLCVAAVSVCLFLLSYRYDNKYTAAGPRGVNGVLELEEGDLSGFVLLTHGWEFYPGELLEPEDFADTRFAPVKIIAIGQYAGFEAGDKTRSPHGSATYRLNLVLPGEAGSCTLELPEIYSAYRLYVNGRLMKQMGNPEPEAYLPVTGNTSVTFEAAGTVEIILAATDYSHFYSGLVYPPAFGAPEAVSLLLNTRLCLRLAFVVLALAAGLYYLMTGLFSRSNRNALLYGLMCLCYAGFTAYPIRGTLFPGGMGWYGLENFCYCAMLMLVMCVGCGLSEGRPSAGLRKRSTTAFLCFGGFVCLFALLVPRRVGGNLSLMAFYSGLIGLYAWVCAFCLTVGAARGALKGEIHSRIMLCGVVAFDCALIMDRLLPAFEPIRGGWFIELAATVLVILVGVITAQNNLRIAREKLALEGKITGIESLVAMQRSYYPVILEGVEEARRARHDLRHHLRVIGSFVSAGKYRELERYLVEYSAGMGDISPLNYCENYIVDVILRHFAALAAQEGVEFIVDAQIPEVLAVSDADICNLISNLLENALEACVYVIGEKKIRVAIKQIHSKLVLLVDNSYDGTVKTRNGRFLSRKRNEREGVGLASVRAVAAKYGGNAVFTPNAEQHIFHSEVIL